MPVTSESRWLSRRLTFSTDAGAPTNAGHGLTDVLVLLLPTVYHPSVDGHLTALNERVAGSFVPGVFQAIKVRRLTLQTILSFIRPRTEGYTRESEYSTNLAISRRATLCIPRRDCRLGARSRTVHRTSWYWVQESSRTILIPRALGGDRLLTCLVPANGARQLMILPDSTPIPRQLCVVF